MAKAKEKPSAMTLINQFKNSLIPVKAEISHHKISTDKDTGKVKGYRVFGLVYDPDTGDDVTMPFWLPVEIEHLLTRCSEGDAVTFHIKEPMDTESTFFEIADVKTSGKKATVKRRPKSA